MTKKNHMCFFLAFFLVLAGTQQVMAGEESSIKKFSVEEKLELKKLYDTEYVRLKQKFQKGKIPNRVALRLHCTKFPADIPISEFSTPPPSEDDLEKRRNELQRRTNVCLEELPENSFLLEDVPAYCGVDCLIYGRATEAGLDFIYGAKGIGLWEDIKNSGYPEDPKSEESIERTRYHESPPVDVPAVLVGVRKNLSNKQEITLSGHYKSENAEEKIIKANTKPKQKLSENINQKTQVAVECNGNQFFGPLPVDPGDLYNEIRRRKRIIMRDLPPNAQDDDFIALKATAKSACTFIVKINEVGWENLLNDKRVTGLRLFEGEISEGTTLSPMDHHHSDSESLPPVKKKRVKIESLSTSFSKPTKTSTGSRNYSSKQVSNKVVGVVDAGIQEDLIVSSSWLLSENCFSHHDAWSRHTLKECVNTTHDQHWVYDKIDYISFCPNGRTSQSGKRTSRVPRRLPEIVFNNGNETTT